MLNNRLILVTGDLLLAAAAVSAGAAVRFGAADASQWIELRQTVLFAGSAVFISSLLELYDMTRHILHRELIVRILAGLVCSFIAMGSVYYLLNIAMFYRGMFIATLLIFGVAQYAWHAAIAAFANAPGFAQRVIVVGTGPLANKIGSLIASTNHRHVLAGYIQCVPEEVYVPAHSILDDGRDIASTVKRQKAQKIVVSLSDRRGIMPIESILSCKLSGVEVLDAPAFYEDLTEKLYLEVITPSCFIFSGGFKLTRFRIMSKNIMDAFLAAAALAVFLPLLPVIAGLIKLDSPGPVFYRQRRVGRGERLFDVLKFRTMRRDAESASGAVWAAKEDPRITRVGRILRKMRFDELPQIVNVVKGDMSFVGPRPERPEFVEQLKGIIPYYSERHSVKPGITGWAQVSYPYGASVEDAIEKLRYDLYYLKRLSLLFDVRILLKTVRVVLLGRGGR